MKTPITKKNMFKKEPTRSILNLIIEYKNIGLRPMFIRFALETEYATPEQIKEDSELARNVSRMKKFFGDRLKRLHQTDRIAKGCINSREHLNYYLQLLRRTLGVIEKKGEHKKVRYIIKQCYYNEGKRSLDITVLDHYSLTDIFEYESPHAVQRRPHVLEPILRVYGMDANVVKHAGHVGMKEKLLSTLDKIEELSLEISQLKDDIGEAFKLKLFLEECKKFNDKKMLEFIQKNLVMFEVILRDPNDIFVKRETAENGKITWVFDKESLESGLNNILTYSSGIFILGSIAGRWIPTGKELSFPAENGRKKKELTSEQIEKIVKTIVKVDQKCKNIYDMSVYPSIIVSECPSRSRTGADFQVIHVRRVTKDGELTKDLGFNRKTASGTFIPLEKRMEK
jgi:hypothetical protein